VAQLESLMQKHFLEYSSYVVLDRAIPDIRDGLKPVQRRIMHTLFKMSDGRFHKVANVIGETMKLHPHGDASIGDALVVLANRDYFIERQGNFGNLLTGHPAAAARYIECRLSPLALDTMFHAPTTEMVPSYDGRTDEPVALPTKLPVVLMLGTEGIAVGMATKILPHNLAELWKAQIDIVAGKKVKLYPDFPQGGLMDVDGYEDGAGKVEARAKIETRDQKHVVITQVPYGTSTESLIASIEAAVGKGRVKISSTNDFTTDKVEIELTLARGATPKEVIPQLYAYTDCSVSASSNLTVIRDRKPEQLTVTEVITYLTKLLKDQLKAELEYDRDQLIDRQHWLTLEQIFIEKKVYQKIEKAKTAEAVRKAVWDGMQAHKKLFVRAMVDEDVTRLLEIRIRRISAYDIERYRKEIKEIEAEIKAIGRKLKNMNKTTTDYLGGLLQKYGDQYPRRTEITRIKAVDKKAVARQNVRLAYDPKTGFFGSDVRGEAFKMSVSEFDHVLAIGDDGGYRIMQKPEKQFFSGKLIYCDVFKEDEGVEFTVVYRDKKKFAFGKLVRIERFIRNREYSLVKNKEGKVDLLLPAGETGKVHLGFVPAKRQRVKSADYDLAELQLTSPTARGVRLAPKPVSKVKLAEPAKRKPAGPQGGAPVAKGGGAEKAKPAKSGSKASSKGGAKAPAKKSGRKAAAKKKASAKKGRGEPKQGKLL